MKNSSVTPLVIALLSYCFCSTWYSLRLFVCLLDYFIHVFLTVSLLISISFYFGLVLWLFSFFTIQTLQSIFSDVHSIFHFHIEMFKFRNCLLNFPKSAFLILIISSQHLLESP